MYKKTIHDFITFLKDCPTAFHTVKRISEILEEQGYKRLWESSRWEVQPEGKYYIIRNCSGALEQVRCESRSDWNRVSHRTCSGALELSDRSVPQRFSHLQDQRMPGA